jgi:hypothetical protein
MFLSNVSNNNPDHIPENWILNTQTLPNPTSRNYKEPVIQICTVFICNFHQHETWLGTGQSQIMTFCFNDMQMKIQVFWGVMLCSWVCSFWFLMFFKTVLPSSSVKQSTLVEGNTNCSPNDKKISQCKSSLNTNLYLITGTLFYQRRSGRIKTQHCSPWLG